MVAAFALGVSVFLQLPCICPAQKSWQVAGNDENIPLWFLCFHLGEYKEKPPVLEEIDCILTQFRWFCWPLRFGIIWKNCITDVQANLLYFLDFRWSIPCLIAEITLLFGQLNLRKDFWEELNAYYYSGDLQITTTRRIISNFFRKCFFADWDISVAPIDQLLSQINYLNKPGIYYNKSNQINSNSFS